MIASTRSPCSIAGSSRKVSSGTYFNRTWRPSAVRRCGAAERSAASVCDLNSACASAAVAGRVGVGFRDRSRAAAPRALRLLAARVERGVVDGRVPEVVADVDAGDGDETEARVGQALELVGDDLAHHLVDAHHAWIATDRTSLHHYASSISSQPISQPSSSTSGAPATNRSAASSSSRTRPRSPPPPPPRSSRVATGSGGRLRPPRSGTGGASRRRSGGSPRASPSTTGWPERGGRSSSPRRASAHQCRPTHRADM